MSNEVHGTRQACSVVARVCTRDIPASPCCRNFQLEKLHATKIRYQLWYRVRWALFLFEGNARKRLVELV